MRLYSLAVVKTFQADANKEPVICSQAIDVSSFGFFQRNSVKEFIVFLTRTVSKRVARGSKTQITENGNVVFACSTLDGLVAIAISDIEYNSCVALRLLADILPQFETTFRGKYDAVSGKVDNFLEWPYLSEMLDKYQKPEEQDKVLKIKRDIEDTKIIMYNAIDQIIERGQKIDDLVSQSEDLGAASKSFYKQAKQTNAGCCSLM
ncbi:putative Synaptobrevin [Trypanosoma vivax]|uniref:Vesicle-associated membrane protein n=1 Tax=Trypanosoma vivax (strain Y486) TaxID=1055687 RepID=G0U3M2_TRYVY|nr:vesicle-associated membrane protein [Trypanosoma vivax]KAH8613777.1 putative Synaptobrevin [Trypanosoma vivax]CCC50879.1 vesicle-associated membrane protein [Trypanosoma vivax Y486]